MGVMQILEKKEMDRIDEHIRQNLTKTTEEMKEKLHLVYIMVWTEICGGSKVLLEYMNRLAKRGHRITIVTYDVKPTWFPMEENIEFIQVPIEEELHHYVPDCDIVVATSWKCIYEAVKSNKAPAVYFEQGGDHLFKKHNLPVEKAKKIEERYQMIPFHYTVSAYARDVMKNEYDIEAEVIPIAIDESIFFKGEEKKRETIEITAIGPEDFPFKNIKDIIQAVTELKQKYPQIHFNWITQKQPTIHQIECIVSPEQKEIGNILRNTDIYICASEYESFGLPILEAMTCGAAVVTTDTGGCRDFVKDRENALMIKMHDIEDMKEKIENLINDTNFRKNLIQNGITTAKQYSWKNSVDLVEKYYHNIAQYKIK